MIETIVLFLLAPFAAIGAVTIGTITGGYVFKKEEKRKEKLKKFILEVLKEEENAKV